MRVVRDKLKSTSGESIAETLVAVLISAFALLMLAGTVNTSSNLITRSQDSLGNYYEANNGLTVRESGSEAKVSIIGIGNSVNETESVKLREVNSEFGNKKLIAYS